MSSFILKFGGGIRGGKILLMVIIFSTILPFIIGGDLGAFLWVTFNYILNPIICSFFIIATIIKLIIETREAKSLIINNSLIVITILYLYISLFETVLYLNILGLSFQ